MGSIISCNNVFCSGVLLRSKFDEDKQKGHPREVDMHIGKKGTTTLRHITKKTYLLHSSWQKCSPFPPPRLPYCNVVEMHTRVIENKFDQGVGKGTRLCSVLIGVVARCEIEKYDEMSQKFCPGVPPHRLTGF